VSRGAVEKWYKTLETLHPQERDLFFFTQLNKICNRSNTILFST